MDDEEKEDEEPAVPAEPARSSTWIGHAPCTLKPRSKGLQAKAVPKPPGPRTPPKAPPQAPPRLAQSTTGRAPTGPRTPPLVRGLQHLVPPGEYGQVVNIWPTGIQMLRGVQAQFDDHIRTRAPGRFHPAKLDVLLEFKAMLNIEEQRVADMCHMVIVDARGPSWAKPPPEELILGHVGTHPEILQQVVDSEAFIMDIGRQLRDQWPMVPGTPAIGVLVFCKSGKHRSVAWSYLIQALVLSEGYHCRVSQTAMNFAGTCGQTGCPSCEMATPHSIMNQAIVRLSMVDAV